MEVSIFLQFFLVPFPTLELISLLSAVQNHLLIVGPQFFQVKKFPSVFTLNSGHYPRAGFGKRWSDSQGLLLNLFSHDEKGKSHTMN